METLKQKMTEVIQAQPDDASYEEIMRELAFERMVDIITQSFFNFSLQQLPGIVFK